MKFKILQKYDEAGYYAGECTFQVGEGIFAPARTTEVPLPEGADLNGNFYRWTGEAWKAEARPTCAADLVGTVVSHESQTQHDQEMRLLIQKFGQEEGFRVRDRGSDRSWEIEKISQEELEAKAIDTELSDFDSKIASLKDRLVTAVLTGDEDKIAELRAEYQGFMTA